jgi:serine/threonine protein kinase
VSTRGEGTPPRLALCTARRVFSGGMTPGAALAEGYLVNERFQLLRLLGRGGMGSVWVARHLSLKIDVAIKFIDAPQGLRDDLRSRFAQEARTAARIQSPHVVNILDYGFDGVRPFIVMELLQGEALNAKLERERRVSPIALSTILTQAAKGLGRAHSLGIVHRDIKPDNLFLSRDEEEGVHVKLLDFGIAREETPLSGVSHRTGTGQLLGTPAYMSPEQALARTQIDYRSDLYSLAVVVYHSVTGRLPFESEAVGELIVGISLHEPPLASSIAPGLSPSIDAWFRRAFQKDPAARFGSAREMAEAFAHASRASTPAYDRTVLAENGPAPMRSAPYSVPVPAPTQHSPGAAPPGTWPPPTARTPPPPTPGLAVTGNPLDRSAAPPQSRSSHPPHPPHSSRVQTAQIRTAPWAGAQLARGGGPSPTTTAPMPVRTPDTFNGQSATQGGDAPPRSRRGPAPLVLALIGLVLLVGVGAAGVYAKRARVAAGGGDGRALVGGPADAVGVGSGAPSASGPFFAPVPPPTSSAVPTSPPVPASTDVPATSQAAPVPSSPASPASISAPVPPPPSHHPSSPKPSPPKATAPVANPTAPKTAPANDYGL